MSDVNRREILGAAAVTAVGLLGVTGRAEAAGNESQQELPTFRYAMEEQTGRVTEGGSAKEATVKQLPISKGLAGVSMRLKPGGLRELHWHANAAEWAYVIKGRVRTTVIAPDGTSEVNDFEPGDVWYFPRGHGHALVGLGPDECHFVLVFDNGAFSEHGTFSITDWLGHTPADVLAKCLGLPESVFAKFPKEELYIPQGRVPPERPEPPRQGMLKSSPQTHRYPLMAQLPHARFPGGEERRVSAREFPISTTITGVIVDLKPGALREPHWHPHANEWLYFITGRARMTLFGSGGRARTEEFGPGDAGYIPQGFGHYLENVGDVPCRVLVAFDSGEYQEISLSTWLASNPTKLVADNFKIVDDMAAKLPDRRVFITTKKGKGA
ncbi:MAG TPA: cupin domain-containing protein [Gemmataceae bacterium]|nr:cupin domain-containing protein [Gemmataceae bacterium]